MTVASGEKVRDVRTSKYSGYTSVPAVLKGRIVSDLFSKTLWKTWWGPED